MVIRVGRRVIGEWHDDIKEFRKKVKLSKHLFRMFDAWGTDGKFFNDVLLPNNATIKIYDEENKILYISYAKDWKKNGQYYHFKGKQDHKAQIFLSRKYFTTKEK